MTTLYEILRPDFLLRDALIVSVVVGVVTPLVGVYFVLRRMIFLGVALPQLSAAGIAFVFLVYRMAVGAHQHGEFGEQTLAMIGSFAFTLSGLLILASLERRGRAMIDARIGFTYAVATAATILLLASDPYGEAQMVNLLKGDFLATTTTSLRGVELVLGVVVVLLFAFRKELLLVSFDRELALVFGRRAWVWDGLLYLVIGVTISLCVTTAGPIVAFGLLVVPPLTAGFVTRHMIAYSIAASAFGALAAFGGFYLAYRADLPLGPTQVGLAAAILVVVAVGAQIWPARVPRRAS